MSIVQADLDAIAMLDLEPIKVKLMHKESGEGWSLEQANMMEAEYRRFLYLMKRFPNEQVAPLFDVDIFWHYHILDTMKYAVDCDSVFGYFLHHFPYVGLRGEDDEVTHRNAGVRMQHLYEETFGEPCVRTDASADIEQAATTKDSPQMAFSYAVTEKSAASAQRTAFSYAVTEKTATATTRTAFSRPGEESRPKTAFSYAPGQAATSTALNLERPRLPA
jgi:hypothetical protein